MVKDKNSILIVDDEAYIRKYLEAVLFNEGFELHFAENGKEGFEKARELKPALILLDVMMPLTDGFQVCRMIREDLQLTDTPIMFITALDDMDSRIKAIESGGDDFITKPIDRMELVARVKTILRLKRTKRLLIEKNEAGKIKAQTQLIEQLQQEISKNQVMANLILQNLQSDEESLTHFLPHSLIYRLADNGYQTSAYRVIQSENLLYILLVDSHEGGLTEALLCSWTIAMFNKNVEKHKNVDVQELLEKLIDAFTIKAYSTPEHSNNLGFDIAFCKIDRNNGNIELNASNCSLYVFKDDQMEATKVANLSDNSPALCLNLKDKEGFWLFSKEIGPEFSAFWKSLAYVCFSADASIQRNNISAAIEKRGLHNEACMLLLSLKL
jgi:DNA-binding response OmpR family regulator